MTFGNYIRTIREEAKISLRAMAGRIGMSPVYLSDIERGNRNAPGEEILEKIANELNITGDSYLKLLDLAAETHNDIPVDVKKILINNPDWYMKIRNVNM